MLVTVVVVVCHMISGTPIKDCEEVIVTDSTMTEELTMQNCLVMGQIGIAKWKMEHPVYSSDKYQIENYMCVPGHYEIKNKV